MSSPAPELGPWLGVVASPRPRHAPGRVILDQVRLALISRLLDEGQKAEPDWLGAWRPAVESVSHDTINVLQDRAKAAAQTSRAPDRVARRAVPAHDDLRILRARIASAGIPLEQAVAAVARGASAEQTFPAIGGAVEESWLALEAMVAAVVGEWEPRAEAVAQWRRPTAILWTVTGLMLAGAAAVGLSLGGYVAAPEWFQPVITWWWSLPWP